jgi:hypothetical protein
MPMPSYVKQLFMEELIFKLFFNSVCCILLNLQTQGSAMMLEDQELLARQEIEYVE